MERPFHWAALLAGLWAFFLFLACFLEEVYWPMFNLFFLALGMLPYVFGSHKSGGLWGAIGDFVTGVVIVSLFAYPIVLHNAYQIGSQSLSLVSMSTVFLIGALWITVSALTVG
jgi:hypothetical protein